jgi:hypothetical protein
VRSRFFKHPGQRTVQRNAPCIVYQVCGNQARVKNADLRHSSFTVIMQKCKNHKFASPILNVLKHPTNISVPTIYIISQYLLHYCNFLYFQTMCIPLEPYIPHTTALLLTFIKSLPTKYYMVAIILFQKYRQLDQREALLNFRRVACRYLGFPAPPGC